LSAVLLTGCSSTPPPEPEEKSALHKVALLYGFYTRDHKGKAPASLDELKRYAQTLKKEQLAPLKLEPGQLDAVFVSPRDREPFVLRPAPPGGAIPDPLNPPVIAYERNGSGGKRYVAFVTSNIEEVDEARFRQLVPDAK
jgi:hypothetical protein